MAPFSRSLRQLGGKLAPSGKKGGCCRGDHQFHCCVQCDVLARRGELGLPHRRTSKSPSPDTFFFLVSGQDPVEALLDLYAEGKIDTAVVLHDRDKVSLPLERKSEVKLEIAQDDYAGDLEPSLNLEPDVASEDSVALCTSTRGSALSSVGFLRDEPPFPGLLRYPAICAQER